MLDRIFDLNKIQSTIIKFNDKVKDEYFNYLINEFGILFTYHSNRIEGTNITLTLNDTRNILNNTYEVNRVSDKNKKREVISSLHELVHHILLLMLFLFLFYIYTL